MSGCEVEWVGGISGNFGEETGEGVIGEEEFVKEPIIGNLSCKGSTEVDVICWLSTALLAISPLVPLIVG